MQNFKYLPTNTDFNINQKVCLSSKACNIAMIKKKKKTQISVFQCEVVELVGKLPNFKLKHIPVLAAIQHPSVNYNIHAYTTSFSLQHWSILQILQNFPIISQFVWSIIQTQSRSTFSSTQYLKAQNLHIHWI